MKVSNKVTIELTQDEAIQLAKILEEDIYDVQGIETRLKREICNQLNIKSWDL